MSFLRVEITLKETSGLSHRTIAQLLNMGHPISPARLINKGSKAKYDQSAPSICYRQLLEAQKMLHTFDICNILKS